MFDTIGVSDAEFRKKIFPIWLNPFLLGQYIPYDAPVEGAVDCVRRPHEAGAIVVYLTGRDESNMGSATRQSLTKLGFPLDDAAVLHLKLNAKMKDLDWKNADFERIAGLGRHRRI